MNYGNMSSDTEHEKTTGAPLNEVEETGTSTVVDKMTERKLMRKLDIRIIPMIMWM